MFLKVWNSAIARGDIQAVRASYSGDDSFVWFEDGARRYSSREEIIAALRQFPADTTIATELSGIRVHVLTRNLAYVTASFDTQLGIPGSPVEFGGVFTSLVRLSEDRWVFASGHSSSRRRAAP